MANKPNVAVIKRDFFLSAMKQVSCGLKINSRLGFDVLPQPEQPQYSPFNRDGRMAMMLVPQIPGAFMAALTQAKIITRLLIRLVPGLDRPARAPLAEYVG